MTQTPAPASTPLRRRVAIALFATLVIGLIVLGVMYRHWAWDYTSAGRYRFDINRNYDFGCQVLDGGYLNLYEDQVRDDPPYERKIDYPPLRLATFAAWAAWTRWTEPAAHNWQPDFRFNSFLIHFNTAMGLLAAMAAFLIVRYWLRVCARASLPDDQPPPVWAGVWRATVAFTLLWFDPGVAIIGHGWPSPNLWLVPMYLWAVYFCLTERWFIGGMVLAIGAMMQGQQLVVAAAFVGWPLMAGQPMRAVRWMAGFAFAFGLVVSGWMLTLRPDANAPARAMNWLAILWVGTSVGLLVLLAFLPRHTRGRKWISAVVAVIASAVIAWPAARIGAMALAFTTVLALLLLGGVWSARRMTKFHLVGMATGLSLLACMAFWGGGTAWWKIGFMYGTERFQHVGAGYMVSNLDAILGPMMQWENVHQIVGQVPGTTLPVEVRHVMLAAFGVLMLAAVFAIARHWRRKDPSLLLALAMPWVLFYTVLPQMSPRYAVFVAGVSVICVGRSLALIPAVWLFTFLTVEQTALCMIGGNGLYGGVEGNLLFGPSSVQLYQTLNPGLSWAVIVTAGTMLVMAVRAASHRR